jgi:hypothetical protein
MNKVSGMRGWTDIGSDMSWEDYGGKWARRARDGSWYVVDFTNMYDACGEGECKRDGQDQYVCEVKRVDLADLDADTLKRARDCVGLNLDDIAEEHREIAQVEACVSYGCSQPLDSFSGNVRPANVRANARRAAEALMRDAVALEAKLETPVNRMGATAREYARGEIMPALTRDPERPENALMLKMVGMPTLGGGTFGEK